MTDREHANAMLQSLEHIVLIRMVERGQSLPDATVKIVALDLMINLERHLRGYTTLIADAKP
jgi:hypothetical protein